MATGQQLRARVGLGRLAPSLLRRTRFGGGDYGAIASAWFFGGAQQQSGTSGSLAADLAAPTVSASGSAVVAGSVAMDTSLSVAADGAPVVSGSASMTLAVPTLTTATPAPTIVRRVRRGGSRRGGGGRAGRRG